MIVIVFGKKGEVERTYGTSLVAAFEPRILRVVGKFVLALVQTWIYYLFIWHFNPDYRPILLILCSMPLDSLLIHLLGLLSSKPFDVDVEHPILERFCNSILTSKNPQS